MSKLITYAYLKEETDISSIVDNTKLDNPIKNACDRLKFLIGTAFYNELVSQVITTPKTLSTDNLAFFDPYVKQFLAWQAYQFYISKANTYETRVGVRIFKEDNSDPASDKIMGEQISLAKQQLQIYKDGMINFLRTEQRLSPSKYPLYTQTCGNVVGSSFGISAVSRKSTVNFSINKTITNQEP
mgnify:CR=1 FL=1